MAFDPVYLFRKIAEANSLKFFYGAKVFLNWEVTQEDLTGADTFLCVFPFEEFGNTSNGSVDSWEVSTVIWVGRKFDAVGGTLSSLDETEQQKYDRRLKYLNGIIKLVLSNLCAEDVELIGRPRVFRELNKFDENTDVMGCELTFTYNAGYDNTVPDIPLMSSITDATTEGFTINWSEVGGATNYYVDVSTAANFATFVTGYHGKDAGNVTSLAITLPAGTYYVRVWVFNGENISDYSNIKTVTISE